VQRNAAAGSGNDLRDTAAHLPRADDENVLEPHGREANVRAAMVRFEHSVEIARPVHEVWEYLTDPERVPEWQSSAVSSHQVTDGPMDVGTRLADERRFVGRRARSEVEVTEFDPERLFTLHGLSGPVRFTVRHRLSESSGGTRLEVEAEADPGGLGRLMRPVIERAAEHELKGDFERLKQRLEAAS
jgi:carbon monoxide dehydrogenase subunit G